MAGLSPRQRSIREREDGILDVARDVLLERGYHGLTMDRLAEETGCPKGTMYQRFGCKEDVILGLARRGFEIRLDYLRRAAAFDGLSRERVLALGESASLFARLHPGDSRIVHIATGPVREKASPERVASVVLVENQCVEVLRGVLRDAIALEELVPQAGATLEEMAFGMWSMVEGAYTFIEGGIPMSAFAMRDPFSNLFRAFNRLADGYGWKPLFAEWDWLATLVRVRKTVFPVEAQQLYGEGAWEGDQC